MDISQRYEVVRGVTKMMIELRDTEETFHQLLLASEKYYFKPLVEKEMVKKGDVLYDLLNGLVGIRKISGRFLEMIKAEMVIPRSGSTSDGTFNSISSFGKNCSGLWEIFSKSFNLLKLFSVYTTLYNKESKNFSKYFKKGSPLGDFDSKTQRLISQKETNFHHGNIHAFDLQSLMITPIQRLPRYKMLLQSMCVIFRKKRELLGKYSTECSKVSGALDLVCYICEYVNNKPKQARSDDTLKLVIRIKYWVDDMDKKETLDYGEVKKMIKTKKKEIKNLRKKIEDEEFVKRQLESVIEKVDNALDELEIKVKNFKKRRRSWFNKK